MSGYLLTASSAVIAVLLALNYGAVQDAYSAGAPPDFMPQDNRHILFVDVHREAYGPHDPPDGTVSFSHQMLGMPNKIPTAIRHIEPHGEDSVLVTFANRQDGMTKFEYERIVYRGDIFIESCYVWPEGSRIQKMTLLMLADIDGDGAVFHHFEGKTEKKLQCKYPDVILGSFGIDWDSAAFEAPDIIPYCDDGYERTKLEIAYCGLTDPPGTFYEYHNITRYVPPLDISEELFPEPGFHNYSPEEIYYGQQVVFNVSSALSWLEHSVYRLNAATSAMSAIESIASGSEYLPDAPKTAAGMHDKPESGAAADLVAILDDDGSPVAKEAALAVMRNDSYVSFDAGPVRDALIRGDAAVLADLAASARTLGEDLPTVHSMYNLMFEKREMHYRAAAASPGLVAEIDEHVADLFGLVPESRDTFVASDAYMFTWPAKSAAHRYADSLERAIDLIPPEKAQEFALGAR